ncbi:MAG: NUDIX domain-containing protein [Myxococcales bacterium]|nr:NUDIX domain-containing protein [Myxococcales bacterium]
MSDPPRDAATVILLRDAPRAGAAGYEAFLLRRRRGASFMSGAYVFPGGAADPDDAGDLRITAARELFEEAGVLLAHGAPPAAELATMRREVLDGAPLAPMLATRGLSLDAGALHYYAHWITPSVEKKRFSARFYVALLPAGQEPSFDDRETVDEAWVTPAEALARVADLHLPPPQVRTFHELAAAASIADVLAECAARAAAPHPIMPRLAPLPVGFALLLPWDPEYETAGTGDAAPMPAGHPLATGPSRFVMEDRAWKHLFAPAGTTTG